MQTVMVLQQVALEDERRKIWTLTIGRSRGLSKETLASFVILTADIHAAEPMCVPLKRRP
jgi:hypothetical protein